MAEKNIVENRPAEDIKERFSSNETVNTVMNGLGKVVDYPMGVVGNLTKEQCRRCFCETR